VYLKIGIIEITKCNFLISCQNSGQKFLIFGSHLIDTNKYQGLLKWEYKNFVNFEICKNAVILSYFMLF